jgi:hypothetical protein
MLHYKVEPRPIVRCSSLLELFNELLYTLQRLFLTGKKYVFHPVFVGRQFLAIPEFAVK